MVLPLNLQILCRLFFKGMKASFLAVVVVMMLIQEKSKNIMLRYVAERKSKHFL